MCHPRVQISNNLLKSPNALLGLKEGEAHVIRNAGGVA
jgi:carbonic anhydrase